MNLVLILFINAIAQTFSIEPRSVNLALDTILEFNNKDNTDIQIIDNVQEFLDKIKNVLKDKDGRRSMNKEFKFTDFLINFFETISTYEDDDLEDVATVIDDEIRKYHYAGCRFFELLQNNDMRKFVGRKLNEIKDKTPDDMRDDVEDILKVLKTRENCTASEFLEYINTLYPKDSRNKLKNFLNNIELYKSKSKRANLDLINLIRDGLRNIIFDHYTNLNVNARKDFKVRLETFWKNFMDPYKVEHKVWNLRYTKFNKRGKDQTTKNASPINREFNEQANNFETQKATDDEKKFNKLNYFDGNTYTTKPTEIRNEFNVDSKNIFKEHFPLEFEFTTKASKISNDLNLITTESSTWNNLNTFSTAKEALSQINFLPVMQKEISIDKAAYNQFKDDVTSKSIVKEFEKSIDLNLLDIPAMVKQKFNAITNDRLKIKKDIFKDININIDTPDETTKKPHEKIKKHKMRLKDKIKNTTPKRFSVVTSEKTEKFYDSEEIYNINDRKTTKPPKKRKSKTTTKRKRKKDTKGTTKSRFMTLFVEEYTGKVKKTRTKHKTTKNRQYTSWKDVKKHRSKAKKGKTKRNRYTYAHSDEYDNIRTTKAIKYKGFRHDKPKHHKQHKTQKKYSKSSGKTSKKSRKWLKLSPIDSYEGMSIETFEGGSYRKNIDFDDFDNKTKANTLNSTILTSKSISKITTTTTPKTTKVETIETIPDPVTTFGPLDFWQGTTKFGAKSKTTILPNATTAAENTTIEIAPKSALRSFVSNTTFDNENYNELLMNETIIPNLEDIISTKLPGTTKTDSSNTTAPKASTTTATVSTITVKKMKPILKRRTIGTTKNKISLSKKSTNATKITEITNATISTEVTKPTFNLRKFLNQSEVLNVEDKRKKDKIQENIMKDMKSIFSPTPSTTVKSLFTDAFNDIENALDLD